MPTLDLDIYQIIPDKTVRECSLRLILIKNDQQILIAMINNDYSE